MKQYKWMQIFAALLLIFFLFQYLSRLAFSAGAPGKNLKALDFQKTALQMFPFDYFMFAEAGYSLYSHGIENQNNAEITRSVSLLKRSVKLNPLYYPAHAFLSKALIAKDYPLTPHFREAVEEAKIAAKLRPGNLEVAVDAVKLLLSLWPFLDEADRTTCRELLLRNISRVPWESFQPILDLWWYYDKDIVFLADLIRENPSLYFKVAEKLVAYRLPLDLRRRFLAAYEKYVVGRVEGRYSALSNFMVASGKDLEILLAELGQVKGYGLLTEGEEKRDDWNAARNLKRKIEFDLIRLLVGRDASKMTFEQGRRVNTLILEFLGSTVDIEGISDLRQFLEDSGYFQNENLSTLLVRTMLNLKSSAFWDVISQVEAFKQSLSFVRQKAMKEYSQLLLLLCDAYIASRLLSQANQVLAELRELVPDDPEIYWRILRVEEVFGPDASETEAARNGKESVLQSRFIQVDAPSLEKKVFLMDIPEFEISLAPEFRERIAGRSLFQVFMNGRIVTEFYCDQIPDVIRIPSTMLTPWKIYRISIHTF